MKSCGVREEVLKLFYSGFKRISGASGTSRRASGWFQSFSGFREFQKTSGGSRDITEYLKGPLEALQDISEQKLGASQELR